MSTDLMHLAAQNTTPAKESEEQVSMVANVFALQRK